MSCRSPSNQRHSAREQVAELAQIHYPYHPRAAQEVEVLSRSRLDVDDFLIIRQPDGTRAHVPQWMTCPAAEDVAMPAAARLSLTALRAMRREVDAVLCSPARTTSAEGVNEAKLSASSVRPVQQRCGAAGAGEPATAARRTRRTAEPPQAFREPTLAPSKTTC